MKKKKNVTTRRPARPKRLKTIHLSELLRMLGACKFRVAVYRRYDDGRYERAFRYARRSDRSEVWWLLRKLPEEAARQLPGLAQMAKRLRAVRCLLFVGRSSNSKPSASKIVQHAWGCLPSGDTTFELWDARALVTAINVYLRSRGMRLRRMVAG